MGTEIEFGRRDRQTYIAVDQIDGLCWPNEFNVRMKGVKCAKALWIGTTNFRDPVSDTTYPYKVVCVGKDAVYSGTEIFADELTLHGKFPHPSVYVNGVSASARDEDDSVDYVDNSQIADRVLVNNFHTSVGISVTRRILSFTQQYNNNYFIYEYTLKNTGIIDESGVKILNAPLTGVVLYLQSRLSFAGVSYPGTGLTGAGAWAPATSTWGRNTIIDAIRMDGSNPGEFRAVLSYWGPMSTTPYGSPAGDIGLPGPNAANVTCLAGYDFAGTVVLHADESASDPTDDITQPVTTMYVGSDNSIGRNTTPTQYNATLMGQKYTQFMSAGHPAQTQAEQIGKDANGWPTGPANVFGSDAGGYESAQGFGPYTLAPGDSVRIVVAEAVAGISWNKACEVAQNWFANNTSAFILPSGYAAQKGYATTSDRNEYKNAWVFSGKDSLFQTFRRAIANYNSNYAIPQPPPPPDNFEVNSGNSQIDVSWSNNAESDPHFDGYRLYRSEGKMDTTYDLIFECNKSTVANSYHDGSVSSGSNYYYYIQTKDDGSTNPGNPALNIPAGEPLVSSRYYTMTKTPASPALINTGTFRSHQSGDWNDVNSWERFNGSAWVNPAPSLPNDTSDVITIMKWDTISVTTADSADQLAIESGGVLLIGNAAIFKIKNGIGTDAMVSGIVMNSGSIILGDSATMDFTGSGHYIHAQNGGPIPIASWENGSTCEVIGVTGVVPANINQNFYDFTWNCPGQSADLNLNWQDSTTIAGTLLIANTNWDHASPDNPSHHVSLFGSDGSYTLGSLNISGSHAALISQTSAIAATVTVNGDLTLSAGGLFSLAIPVGGSTYFLKGNLAVPDSGYIASGDLSGVSSIVFSGLNAQRYSIPSTGPTFIGMPGFRIGSGSSLWIGSDAFGGSGNFAADSGASVETTHPEGLNGNIKVTGTKRLSIAANYTFSGTAAQVTGSLMPDTVGNLTINDTSGVALSRNVVVNGTVEMKSGKLSTGDNSLLYGTNGSLRYSGTTSQVTTDAEFPSSQGPKNLIINNTKSVTLHASRAIKGRLELYNYEGATSGKLILGVNSLTADSASSNPNSLFVYNYVAADGGGGLMLPTKGSAQQFFPVGTGIGFAPVWIANTGTPDTIRVQVMNDFGKPVGGGRVVAKWQIGENTPGGGNYRIRLAWPADFGDSLFQSAPQANWRIFRLSDTTQIAAGGYLRGTFGSGYSIQYPSITDLDVFTVGTFTGLTDDVNSQPDIPKEFGLSQNYPNPFNPKTVISYRLPVASHLGLKVYDVLGREVATLTEGLKEPGYYTTTFSGSGISSGVYILRLTAAPQDGSKPYIQIRKMMLIK
jgi:hypothetical protein